MKGKNEGINGSSNKIDKIYACLCCRGFSFSRTWSIDILPSLEINSLKIPHLIQKFSLSVQSDIVLKKQNTYVRIYIIIFSLFFGKIPRTDIA